MKRFNVFPAALAILLAVSLAIAACSADDDDEENANSTLNGTWVNASGGKYVFNNGNLTGSIDNVEAVRGIYTTTGNTITMIMTEISGVLFDYEFGLSYYRWYSERQLRRAIIDFYVEMYGMTQAEAEEIYEEYDIDEMFQPLTATYLLSGNMLYIIFEGETIVYVKQ